MQGLILSDLFERAGYSVVTASAHLNRWRRLADIVRTLIRQSRCIDILVLEVYGGASFIVEDIASWLARSFGMRVIMWLHGGALPSFVTRYPGWAGRVLRRADLVVVPSHYLERAISAAGFSVRVIPNVIDFPRYRYRVRRALKPHLFWMRNFHSLYNPELVIRALARLRDSLPDAKLVMAGSDGGCGSRIRELTADLGLEDAVSFPGFLDMPGKVRFGQASDIFVNTSRVDNMPVALVEACAMGLPVISTAVGGVPDFLTDRQTGLLVRDDDEEELIGAIQRLLSDPDLAERLSTNGRRLARRSSWGAVQPQWEQLFSELLAHPANESEIRSAFPGEAAEA
jgi:L-malate glycosyltransferase